MKIKYKFALGFTVIFIISTLMFNIIITTVFEKHINNLIKEDLTLIYKNSYKNIEYFFTLNGLSSEENIFLRKSHEIALNLSEQNNCNVELYDTEGNLKYKYASEEGLSTNRESKDMNLIASAKENRAIAHIYKSHGKLVGSSSYAVFLENNSIGIVKFYKDYSNLYQSNKSFIDILFIISFVAFILIFLLCYILANKLVSPILTLKEGFKEIEKGNYDVNIDIAQKDEIGELTEGFLNMKDKIKMQIDTIQGEKEKILTLEKTRTEFFNNVTHELKTPLTTIAGYAQIIADRSFNDIDFKDIAIERINSESQRMHNMVISLLEISKNNSYVSTENIKEVNIKNLLENIIRDLSIKASKYNLTLNYELIDITIKGKEEEFRRLFINLIDNSIKYSIPNSEITIGTSNSLSNFQFHIENIAEEIPKEKFNNIFEPFFKADINKSKELGSNGLGLYICKQIVENYKGSIDIDYFENKFIVKVTFPNTK